MLMEQIPNQQLGFLVNHITRKPREGEIDGTHYNFTSVEAIQQEIAQGKFFEYAGSSRELLVPNQCGCC
jgi:guanylate kinase